MQAMPDDRKRTSPAGILVAFYILLVVGIVAVDRMTKMLLAMQEQNGGIRPVFAPLARLGNAYLAAREHWLFYAVPLLFGPVLLFLLLKKWLTATYRWAAETAGFAFKKAKYTFPSQPFSFREAIEGNRDPENQVALGADAKGRLVYLTDTQRSMHIHLLGQTGSGKTKSVIEPLVYQDMRRQRGVLMIDAKGSAENEDRLTAMAAAVGRLTELKILTLNPYRKGHTYNPLHLIANANPRAVAERIFMGFAGDMDNPYYRDQASQLFRDLVCVLASTGKRFAMPDVAAAIASPDVRAHVFKLASDRAAVRQIEAQFRGLGREAGKTFTGLLAAVRRYDVPQVNAYDPDIILEEEFDRDGLVAFYLPANLYPQLARYLGVVVFQHLQQIGALRQLDPRRSQRPVFVYADEFYTFAYEGMTNAVNKLRDAKVSILLSHQSMSDLEKVSKEYAKGIWDNTRTKIVLYQNDPELCERVARALGTEKDVKKTNRVSADSLLVAHSTLEASEREVDEYRLHPNHIKALASYGQAYLVNDSSFVGVNLELLDRHLELPAATPPAPKRPSSDGLRLHELFVQLGDSATTTRPEDRP
jgi:type IV secretory pathway TraG/TraD family ATPase VirD4